MVGNQFSFSSQERFGLTLCDPWKGGWSVRRNPFKPGNSIALCSVPTLCRVFRLYVGGLCSRWQQQQHKQQQPPSYVSAGPLEHVRGSNGFKDQQRSGILASRLEQARWKPTSWNLAIHQVHKNPAISDLRVTKNPTILGFKLGPFVLFSILAIIEIHQDFGFMSLAPLQPSNQLFLRQCLKHQKNF